MALAAKEAGYDVWVAAADTGDGEKIKAYGLKFVPIPVSRSGTGLIAELKSLWAIFRVYRKLRPDLVHHISIKPVIYGSLVAKLYPKTPVVNAVTGMGFVFSGDEKASGLKRIVSAAYRFVLSKNKMRVIFQNEADRDAFVNNKLVSANKTVIIRGSGVDASVFKPVKKETDKPGDPIILLASRMIWDKGVAEFVEAAAIVKEHIPDARFILAGKVDDGNPNSVPKEWLQQKTNEGFVEWLGHRDDMLELITKTTIIALPTFYPEGVPKILIEAAAAGKPIVATNRPGCNDIVQDGVNGILIPERDSKALAAAILKLLHDPEKMTQMGKAGRQRVLDEFDVRIVTGQTLELYRKLGAGS